MNPDGVIISGMALFLIGTIIMLNHVVIGALVMFLGANALFWGIFFKGE